MTQLMKAAVLFELNNPLKIIELPILDPKPGQVLVKLMASGICHTQLHEISGQNASGPMNPNLLGHEGSGKVIKVGDGVSKVKEGDRVILSWIKGSGQNVLPEKYNYNGSSINVGFVTTFNEYTLASENRVTKIPDTMPFIPAALIGCAVATGCGSVFNSAKVKESKTVLVIGIGGIGINMVHASQISNASMIIAVDIDNDKLNLSKELGATHIINSKDISIEELESKILRLTNNEGLDYAFETVGKKEIMELVYRVSKKTCGKSILCGVPTPPGIKIEIDPFPLYYGRKIFGTGGGETNPDTQFAKYCNMYLEGDLKLDKMISHVISFSEINYGIDQLRSGKCCRVVIDFTK